MAVDRKYGKVTTHVQAFNDDDEPVFIIRAKDQAAIPALLAYAIHAHNAGSDIVFVADVMGSVKRFADWQAKNETKVPD